MKAVAAAALALLVLGGSIGPALAEDDAGIANPVVDVAADLPRFVPDAGDLFASQARPQLPWLQLRERLRARLGDAAVRPVVWRADHRPECILLDGPPVDPRIRAVPRPGWLLPTPTACRERIERLVAGPERIESGWWDDGDVRRDYYVAETVDGRRIWLFREAGDLAGDGPVCVHGLFG